MPKELKLQKELVDVVNDSGGFAFKLSNRFLIGVPDLLVKMPEHSAVLMECKQDVLPVKLKHIIVALTPLQWRFLRKAFNAGMNRCGVVSFAQRDKNFAMCILLMTDFIEPVIKVPLAAYRIGHMAERKSIMLDQLTKHLDRFYSEPS